MSDEAPPVDDQPQDTPPPAADRPEWMPEKFWTPEGPNVENLAKAYATLEKNRANPDELKQQWEAERLAGRPEAPDKYALPEDDAFDAEALAASPVVELWRKAAFDAGLGQDQFNAVLTDYAKHEMERIEAHRTEEMGKLGENAKARAEAVGLWASKQFGEGEKFDAIAQVCTTAAGVEAIEQLMGMLRDGPGNDNFEDSAPQAETLADIRKLMDSREYWDPQKRDPAVVARVEAFFKKQAAKQ